LNHKSTLFAIGASLANKSRRIILFEGDGGFAQNFQELGTVRINSLNLKIFVMDNQGYQSIRNNQKTSFMGTMWGAIRIQAYSYLTGTNCLNLLILKAWY